MGYFSNLAIKTAEGDIERSHLSPEIQLLRRLDDLTDRHEELIKTGAPYRGEFRYMPEDIKYALPEHLCAVEDVERAIEFVKEGLEKQYRFIEECTEEAELPLAA